VDFLLCVGPELVLLRIVIGGHSAHYTFILIS
jgi:hypothetical protein